MNFLIKHIEPIEGDPEFPQIDATIEGIPEKIGPHMMGEVVFCEYVRNNVSYPINIINKLININSNEIHMKLDGKDVLTLKVGDYIVKRTKMF